MHRGRRRRRHARPARPRHAALRRRTAATSRSGTPQRPTEELIAEGVLVDVPGVFPHDPSAPAVAAIVLTHSHLDHYGLAHHAHPAIPVYGSRGTLAILDVGRVFFPDAALPADLRLLPDDEPLRLGPPALIPPAVSPSRPSPSTTPRRTRGRCSAKPTGSACSTPATCAHTGAPASASRSSSPTSACAASTGCSARARRWARRAARTACAPRPTSRSELLALARARAGQAPRRRRLRPEPRPPRQLLPGGAPGRPPAGRRRLPGLRAAAARAALAEHPAGRLGRRARQVRAPPGRSASSRPASWTSPAR